MASYTNYPGPRRPGPQRPASQRPGPRRPVSPAQARRRAEARRRRKRRILRNRIIFAVICLALLALLILGITKAVSFVKDKLSGGSSSSQSQSQSASGQSSASTDPAADPASQAAAALPPADPNDWRMILVNNNIPLPDGYEVTTDTAETANGKTLQAEAAAAYIRMKDAAAVQGVQLLLCSGYRSVDYQTTLFNEEVDKWKGQGYSDQDAYDKAKTIVAIPGYSEHNSGLAADIVTPDHQTLDEAFAETDAFRWLSEHAHEYGFILRYPLDKQSITGIIYEPWHYRYVGPENAAAIRQSGLCLEEYLSAKSEG